MSKYKGNRKKELNFSLYYFVYNKNGNEVKINTGYYNKQ